MKVGDGEKANRAEGTNRREGQRQEKAKREKSRSFSEVMDRRKTADQYKRGNERGREIKEGTVQRQGREAERHRLTQREPRGGRGEAPERRNGRQGERKDGLSGERGVRDKEVKESRECTEDVGDGYDLDADPRTGESTTHIGESTAENPQEIQEVRERVGGTEGPGYAEASRRSEPAMTEVARQIVNAVRVGEDGQARRVVFLDVTVPGQGDVRIRLRRDGSGMEVRMRADNDALARTLQEGVGQLREKGREKDIQFTSIQVVR